MISKRLRRFITICTSLSCILLPISTQAAPINLVTNGNFETVTTFTPNVPGGSYQYVGQNSNLNPSNGGSSPALFGWTTNTVWRGIVLFNSGYQPVAGGNYAIQFESYTDNISQVIQTVAGHTYTLAYDLSAYGAPGQSWPSYLQFRLNGAVVGYSPTVSTNIYSHQQFTFTATGATNLEIWSIGAYPQLDNVSVTDVVQVAEPASLSLLMLGLTGLTLVKRRRRHY
ncbi:MAG: PEP-CTERM sorting domain-containing protein [Gallionella sp.]|nr:PEP-CTERM sorting domain-containing protein [Gallionella sp.]MDD4947224.1 PEP-CTERM sorting domain-containing protein [Gallionella sp.]MDD5612423.1 PEP-CTERM sorting domain-containing protein [Gallionella sp.]